MNTVFQLIAQSPRIFMGNVCGHPLEIPQQRNLKLFEMPADLLLDQRVNADFQFGSHLAWTIFLQPIWGPIFRQLKNSLNGIVT
ncbi:MAG TPA: hypothetical protein VG345_00085 [Bryobacteraceae bacterium]|nr:hypothetical protein [Bryobacteraceae bacterium]